MKIYYDTEFLENGHTIELISIGMVTEDGDELYCVNGEAPIEDIYQHEWLRNNVWPHLPVKCTVNLHFNTGEEMPFVEWDEEHPDFWSMVWNREIIANAVKKFITRTPNPELWAWYGAFDHVALAWLFGPMSELPQGIPMWTNDLKQEVTRLEKVLAKPIRFDPVLERESEHHALADAKLLKYRAEWLEQMVR